MKPMIEDLECGCVVTEHGIDYLDNPILKIHPCDAHDNGYLYVGDLIYNLSDL